MPGRIKVAESRGLSVEMKPRNSSARRRKATRLLDGRATFWLLGSMTVSVTATAATLLGAGSAITATVAVLVALAVLGWALWRSDPDRRGARKELGTALLASVVVAGAVGCAQLAIEDRRDRAAAQESLRMTLGLQ